MQPKCWLLGELSKHYSYWGAQRWKQGAQLSFLFSKSLVVTHLTCTVFTLLILVMSVDVKLHCVCVCVCVRVSVCVSECVGECVFKEQQLQQ